MKALKLRAFYAVAHWVALHGPEVLAIRAAQQVLRCKRERLAREATA